MGGAACSSFWTRSAGCVRESPRTPCRSRQASLAGRRSIETHRHHSGFALAEGVQYVVKLLLQQGEAHGVRRNDRLRILDQVSELRVAVFAERSM